MGNVSRREFLKGSSAVVASASALALAWRLPEDSNLSGEIVFDSRPGMGKSILLIGATMEEVTEMVASLNDSKEVVVTIPRKAHWLPLEIDDGKRQILCVPNLSVVNKGGNLFSVTVL